MEDVATSPMTPQQLIEYAQTLAAMLRHGADRIEAEVARIIAAQAVPTSPPAPSGG